MDKPTDENVACFEPSCYKHTGPYYLIIHIHEEFNSQANPFKTVFLTSVWMEQIPVLKEFFGSGTCFVRWPTWKARCWHDSTTYARARVGCGRTAGWEEKPPTADRHDLAVPTLALRSSSNRLSMLRSTIPDLLPFTALSTQHMLLVLSNYPLLAGLCRNHR